MVDYSDRQDQIYLRYWSERSKFYTNRLFRDMTVNALHCVTNFQYIFVYLRIRLSLYTTFAADSKYHIIYSIPSTFSTKRRLIEFCDCLLVFIYSRSSQYGATPKPGHFLKDAQVPRFASFYCINSPINE